MILVSLLWSCLAVTVLLLIRRQFHLIEHIQLNQPLEEAPVLTVIVPVRNEAANIEKCLSGLLLQDYPNLEVIIVNDASTDNTVDLVHQTAGGDTRVQLIEAGPLPPGWKGKTNACWRGALAAKGEWLCFIDADTAPAAPALMSSAIATCQKRGLDMLSCQPFQELGSVGERLIYPTGFILLLLLLDFKRINDPRRPDAAATGQFIIVRRQSYNAIGGHQNNTIRNTFLEDMALAKLMKLNGFRLSLMLGDRAIRTRMYVSMHEMWSGLSRLVFDLFHGSIGSIVAAIGAILIGWWPIFVIFWQLSHASPDSIVLATLAPGIIAMLTLHIWLSKYFRIPAYYGIIFPVGYALGAGILVNGIWQRKFPGVTWRGRQYI